MSKTPVHLFYWLKECPSDCPSLSNCCKCHYDKNKWVTEGCLNTEGFGTFTKLYTDIEMRINQRLQTEKGTHIFPVDGITIKPQKYAYNCANAAFIIERESYLHLVIFCSKCYFQVISHAPYEHASDKCDTLRPFEKQFLPLFRFFSDDDEIDNAVVEHVKKKHSLTTAAIMKLFPHKLLMRWESIKDYNTDLDYLTTMLIKGPMLSYTHGGGNL